MNSNLTSNSEMANFSLLSVVIVAVSLMSTMRGVVLVYGDHDHDQASMASTTTAATCEGDFQGLIDQCAKFVMKAGPKIPPTQGCCDIIKKVDVPCVCQHVTKDVEKVISMEKMVYVAEFCGKSLPHGTKCGSFTIP